VRLSIRWRLALWHTLALAVVLTGFAGVVYGLVAHALYEQADRNLLSGLRQLEQSERAPGDPDGRIRHWLAELEEHQNLLGVVYGPDGVVRARTAELPQAAVPPRPAVAAAERRLESATLPVLGRQRVLVASLRPGGRRFDVVLLASLADVDRELGQLLAALLTTVPVALLLSLGLGYGLARRSLAPMERLRSLTEEITADRLDRRLPVANPGDELGRLAQTINAVVGRLERSFAEVRRFTADASHELRTPLTAIRTEAEVALGNSLSTDEHRQLLGSILEECERLTRMTDQLLALAREDAGGARHAFGRLDLAALLGSVAETLRPLAQGKGVRLHAEATRPVSVRGDETRLRQVFYNLLDNAIKYTPEGGEVELTLTDQGGSARVTVRDTGVGIPPEHLPHVFDRFYRVDRARSRAEGGTGLGLSIAQSIVASHGGTIALASTPGQGTTCTVVLPSDASSP
jgi:heavy metal sensor kinase